MNLIRRFYSVESMVRDERRQDELPGNRDAYRELLRIAVPSVVEMLAVSLVGSVDTMMVGTLGPAAIAAVGLTNQPRLLMLCMFMALNVGVTAVVARRKGEGRQEDARQTLRSTLVIGLMLCAVMMTLALSLSRPLMKLAGAKADTIGDANAYFRVLAWALPVNALTLSITAAQRGVGNTRITMRVNIAANLVNVFFNYLLINGHWGFPALGVTGAAIATAIGFFVGFLMSLYSVVRPKAYLHLRLSDSWRLKKETLAPVIKVGGNAILEQLAMRVGFFTFARIIADLGTMAYASHQICQQFINITFTFGDGMGVAATALVGLYLGKKRPDLSMMFGKIAQRIALTVSFCLLFLIILLRAPLVGLFTDDPDVMALSVKVMILVALFQPFQTSSVIMGGCLRGAGDTKFVARSTTLCVVFIRPLCALAMIHLFHMGLIGAWCACVLDQMVRVTLVYTRFSRGKWTKIRV